MTLPKLLRAGAPLACAFLVAGAAAPQEPPPVVARPDVLDRLMQCRSLPDGDARLTCYDAAADALASAERGGEVVVIERGQIRAARRQLFGFNSPALSGLLEPDGEFERIDGIESTLVRASQSDGRWTFALADGSEWRQIDSGRIRFDNRAGEAVRVRRAALGSFQLVVSGSRAVRVRRQ